MKRLKKFYNVCGNIISADCNMFRQSYKNLMKIFEKILQGVKIIFLDKFEGNIFSRGFSLLNILREFWFNFLKHSEKFCNS